MGEVYIFSGYSFYICLNTFDAEQLISRNPVADSTPAIIRRCPSGSILPRPNVVIVVSEK